MLSTKLLSTIAIRGNGGVAFARPRSADPSQLSRAAAVVIAAVAVALFTGATAAIASARHAPDLVLVSLSGSPASVTPGSIVSARFREMNVGDGRAGVSMTRLYLSLSRHLGPGAIRLLGAARIRPLRPGRKATSSVRAVVPASTPRRSYLLIACANDGRTLSERRTGNDCRVAKRRVTVTSGQSGSSGASGGAGGTSGPGGTATVCVPRRPPTLTSTDPSCFDGDAAHGIFVSAVGYDGNPGTMAAPKRTLAAAISSAVALGNRDVYVSEGAYPEVLTVANGVSVYGGYDLSWQRSPSNITKITGAGSPSYFNAAVALNVTKPTALQLLTLTAGSPTGSGGTTYGLRGAGSPGLVLDHVDVRAGSGTAGSAGGDGANGPSGANGGAGAAYRNGGFLPGAGGSSPVGHPGGEGGYGAHILEDHSSSTDGAPGQSMFPDQFGRMGGPGGLAGSSGSSPDPGTTGYAGDSGHIGADGSGGGSGNAAPASGFWVTEPGDTGQRGSAGHGGGGGGGGGSDHCTLGNLVEGGDGGGGGGGGGGGDGGIGGQGGGGSFGIFLVNSTGALIRDSRVSAANGGAGGPGGRAGYPGSGGLGGPGSGGSSASGACDADAAAGGNGGPGGGGGLGGDGGGGAGGPSIAILGIRPADTPGTTTGHGHGGSGASGRGGTGATGLATDYR